MTSSVKIYGLIGFPLGHSLSPKMHNAAFKELGINAEYKLFEVKPEGLEDFLLNNKDIAGFNITIPYKVKAREILESKFPSVNDETSTLQDSYYVTLSGAINTVKRQNNILLYYNTDAHGFLRALRDDLGFEVKNKKVLLIGCGGVGRAIIAALSWRNQEVKKIFISDISNEAMRSAENHFKKIPQYEERLKNKLEFISNDQIPEKIKECQLLVNASPVGMKEGDSSVIGSNLLHENLAVYDVIYNRETKLIEEANKKGLAAKGGLGMLLYQGVAAWELWMERSAPVDIMKNALEKEIKE